MHDARVETHQGSDKGRQDRPFAVTVKTLAGHSRHDQVRPSERVQDVTAAAVRFFVSRRQLDDGPYSLTLPRLGGADLDPTGTLADVGVVRDDVLVLVSRTPQVDG